MKAKAHPMGINRNALLKLYTLKSVPSACCGGFRHLVTFGENLMLHADVRPVSQNRTILLSNSD